MSFSGSLATTSAPDVVPSAKVSLISVASGDDVQAGQDVAVDG